MPDTFCRCGHTSDTHTFFDVEGIWECADCPCEDWAPTYCWICDHDPCRCDAICDAAKDREIGVAQ